MTREKGSVNKQHTYRTAKLQVTIAPELKIGFQIYCLQHGVSMSDQFERMATDLMNKKPEVFTVEGLQS
jgi:hypothetical protein